MAAKEDYLRPKTFDNNTTSLALTEFTINPSPPNDHALLKAKNSIVPASMLLPTGCPDYLRLILTSRVYEVVTETPSRTRPTSAAASGAMSYSSARIYSQSSVSVAYSARCFKIPAVVVMPLDTPDVKIKNVSRFGCSVILHGTDFDAARQEAARLEKLHGLVSIPALDDPYVIAGQGTVGMEILRQTDLQNLTAIFCCVGLVAGIGVYIKRVAPHVKIIGVEHFNANAIVQSLKASKRVVLSEVGLFADSGSIKTADEETVRVCREVVDEIVQATTDEACAAIKDMFEDTRSIVEPAGALALAGLKKWVSRNPLPNLECSLVAITSGADMEFHHLRFVAERAALRKREAYGGAFQKYCLTLISALRRNSSWRNSHL
ncbi:hypothetical protein P3342_004246 [Pyrenophora teres f. teres]|nr:hypothetical protein P3342_004246 [Pyrenophora teres f. teres]